VQIEQEIRCYSRFLTLRTLAVYGGVNINRQFNALRNGVDIVVATPGRLLDHMQRRTIDLRHVEVLVLDEADRMFDMGFIRDVRRIISAIPTRRQTMLFSATVTPEISSLAAGVQKSPIMIQIGRPRNPIETITQNIYLVDRDKKIAFLLHLLQNGQLSSVLVFSRTKHGADRINRYLERAGIVSVAIHSGRNQSQRERAMDGFKSGKYRVMVATDIAARGIDVTGISHVINFDVPVIPEDYIHRIGRTGRLEALGDAITLVSREEHKYLRQIERFIGREFTPIECPGFTYIKPITPKPLLGLHRGRFSAMGRRSRRTFGRHHRLRR
jgi:ATP-dependent RNA helicase RhlE